jgi:restriction system protein
MAVWLTRAGPNGQFEELALTQGVSVGCWGHLPDLDPYVSREAIERIIFEVYIDDSKHKLVNLTSQVHAFRSRMQADDLVVLPSKTRSVLAFGRVAGPYRYRADWKLTPHTRPINWFLNDVPRTIFDSDILHSFGAFLTVCRISRNDAEERIRAILKTSYGCP